ncbi:MAG: hypothetical protein ACKOXF_07625 [Chitinophagaceae bacterium]
MAHQITKITFLLGILVFGLNACTEDTNLGPNPRPANPICDSTKFKFYADILPIIKTNCNDIACHGSGPRDFTTYSGIRSFALNGTLMGALKHEIGFKPMPTATEYLSDCDIKKIQKWIDNGAPNN